MTIAGSRAQPGGARRTPEQVAQATRDMWGRNYPQQRGQSTSWSWEGGGASERDAVQLRWLASIEELRDIAASVAELHDNSPVVRQRRLAIIEDQLVIMTGVSRELIRRSLAETTPAQLQVVIEERIRLEVAEGRASEDSLAVANSVTPTLTNADTNTQAAEREHQRHVLNLAFGLSSSTRATQPVRTSNSPPNYSTVNPHNSQRRGGSIAPVVPTHQPVATPARRAAVSNIAALSATQIVPDWHNAENWTLPGPAGSPVQVRITEMAPELLYSTLNWAVANCLSLHSKDPDYFVAASMTGGIEAKRWLANLPAIRSMLQTSLRIGVALPNSVAVFVRSYLLATPVRHDAPTEVRPWSSPQRLTEQEDLKRFLSQPLQVARDRYGEDRQRPTRAIDMG